MASYLHPLQRLDIVGRNSIEERVLANIPLAKILDALSEIAESTSELSTARPSVELSHCASIPMTGGPGACAEIGCRIRRADEVARFAALYSDCVYFHNEIADYAPSFGHPPDEDSPEFRRQLADDLIVQLHLEPLVEAGLMAPFSTPSVYCTSCFARQSIGDIAGSRVDPTLKLLSERLLDDIAMSISKDEYGYTFHCSTTTDVFGHPGVIITPDDVPEGLKKRQSILRRIERGERIEASRALRKDLDIHKREATAIVYNAIYQMAASELTGSAFLAHREIDIDTVESLSNDEDMHTRNRLIANEMEAIVPLAADVPLEKLATLREREQESFVRFRAALHHAVKEVANNDGIMPEKAVRQLHNDIVNPEIARLEQALGESKRDLIKTPLVSAAGVIAAIGIGTYFGLLAGEIAAIGKALGLGKVTYDAVSKTGELLDTKKSIRQENYYYLWKVRHAARASRKRH